MNMTRWLIVAVFSFLMHLHAFDIPQEASLHKGSLGNGIVTWIQVNHTPSHMTSVRVVWAKDGIPVSHALDCPSSDSDDLMDFFDDCKEKMGSSFKKAAVIAVGDFAIGEMQSLIKNHFEDLRESPSVSLPHPILIQHLPVLEPATVVLAYPASLDTFQSLNDLKKLWCLYFFQGLVQSRFEQSLKPDDAEWLPSEQNSHFFLPQKVCMARASTAPEKSLEVLSCFLHAMKTIYEVGGFSEKEFMGIKTKVQKRLLSVNHKTAASSILASYFADWFVLDHGCPAYSFFVSNSLELLQNLTLNDVHNLFKTSIKDDSRLVEMAVPISYNLSKAAIQKELDFYKTDALVSNIKEDASNAPDIVDLYVALPITQDEADTIYKIVDTVANTNVLKLAIKQGDLEKKGKKVQGVHPLKFLGTIFANPFLKSCMREIEDSYFKWDGFVYGPSGNDGLANRLSLESDKNNMLPYLPGFCQAVKANPDAVRSYIQKRDWEGLVRYLIN